jgi:large subunit ribosomal protein L21e
MATSGKGFRSGTRRKFTREKRSKFTVERFMKELKTGQKVVIRQDSSCQGGMPHRRYLGKIGTVEGKRGRAYVVGVRIGNMKKQVLSKPEHLKPHRE